MKLKTHLQKLLTQHNCSKSVIRHSAAVADRALEIAKNFSVPIDATLVFTGAMLHDIGRGETHGLEHFISSARIVRKEGFSEDVARIVERHIGAGITAEEAGALGLPPQDYIAETPEEIVVSYADNLTSGTKRLTFDEARTRFVKRLGSSHPALSRLDAQHRQIHGWSKKS
ncbi:MAG TPA: TIGR00295 family protein [Euryarchaeota archaeon]|nr:tRNA 2'-O-methylase [archaeon BMS3Abin16]GBE56683.1 tRNA 2'-O-methylase [archaeon BMS3Bbin16]HDH28246.1 TIGR00295 family protein [Euryarchaeota archaeon]